MPNDKNWFCEFFLAGKQLNRQGVVEFLSSLGRYAASGNTLRSSVIEIEVRDNPRLKGETQQSISTFRSDGEMGFVFSELVLEVEPIADATDVNGYVAAVRELLNQLRAHGFVVHVASDFEKELAT